MDPSFSSTLTRPTWLSTLTIRLLAPLTSNFEVCTFSTARTTPSLHRRPMATLLIREKDVIVIEIVLVSFLFDKTKWEIRERLMRGKGRWKDCGMSLPRRFGRLGSVFDLVSQPGATSAIQFLFDMRYFSQLSVPRLTWKILPSGLYVDTERS
jgi:hypothetical protein